MIIKYGDQFLGQFSKFNLVSSKIEKLTWTNVIDIDTEGYNVEGRIRQEVGIAWEQFGVVQETWTYRTKLFAIAIIGERLWIIVLVAFGAALGQHALLVEYFKRLHHLDRLSDFAFQNIIVYFVVVRADQHLKYNLNSNKQNAIP